MDLRELRAFVAVVEEGGVSAASRRLHVRQSALSQTVSGLERELGAKLLERGSAGVRPTEAGRTLLEEARAVLARYRQALRTMGSYSTETSDDIRLGVPVELAPDVLSSALARFAEKSPESRVVPCPLSTAAQIEALQGGELDVGLVRERPAGSEFETLLVLRENLGVLLESAVASQVVRRDGVRLDELGALQWVGFPRSASPAWYDELTGVLRSHGIDIGPATPHDQELIADVSFAAGSRGHAFALAPANHPPQLPENVTWAPLVDRPVVRRTWVVWPADSRRGDIGQLIASFEIVSFERPNGV